MEIDIETPHFDITVVPGAAATVQVGSTSTGTAGSQAAVSNSGTPNAAVLDFTIPQGPTGPAATVAVGTVTTGTAGSQAAVSNSGSSGAAVLNFTIPRGQDGEVTLNTAQTLTNKTLDATNTSTKFISRSVANVVAPTALSSTAATDYITFVDMRRTVALLHCEGSDASTIVMDSSNVGANWTCVGDAQLDTDQFKFGSSSLKFDGTGDYITPTGAAENFVFGMRDFTIEMWVRPASVSGTDVFYDQRPSGIQGEYPVIYLASGVVKYYTTNADRITGSTLSVNTWYHIALCRSGTSTKLFVDGTQVGSTYIDTNSYLASTEGVKIGVNAHSSDTNNFDGHIDEINIINGFAKYTTNFTPPDAPLDNITEPVTRIAKTVALLHCDGADASTVFTDSSSPQKNWSRNGTTVAISTAQSKFGGSSISFPGSQGNSITPTGIPLEYFNFQGDFTVEMWFRPTINTSLTREIYIGNATAGYTGISMYTNSTTGVLYGLINGSVMNGPVPELNTWSHLAATRSNGVVRFFLNGIQFGTNFNYNGPLYDTALPVIGNKFNGHIDEINIVNGIAKYAANFTPSSVPSDVVEPKTVIIKNGSTVALLHCNGASGSTTITDSGVLGSNWTAVGNAAISTAQSKFGGSSLYFDGSAGTYIAPTASLSTFAFGTGDFTIETWVYNTVIAGASRHIIDMRPLGINGDYPTLRISEEGYLQYIATGTTRITSDATVITAGAWFHVALSRASGVTRAYVNGVQVGSWWTDATNYQCAALRIGNRTAVEDATGINGHLNDFRITRGLARYTTNFTPPTAPHPDPPTVALPTAAGNSNRYTAKCIGTQSFILSAPPGQTIDGSQYVVADTGDVIDAVSDGTTNWRMV